MMANYKATSGHLFVVRSSNCLRDRGDQGMRFIEMGPCSLQEKQMLVRSVKALICRRNCDGD